MLSFGAFAFAAPGMLALLLAYQDWRPIVLAAGLIAVHHIAFDRLQAAGVAVYCTPQADFLKVLLHAGYVVMQAQQRVGQPCWRYWFDYVPRAADETCPHGAWPRAPRGRSAPRRFRGHRRRAG